MYISHHTLKIFHFFLQLQTFVEKGDGMGFFNNSDGSLWHLLIASSLRRHVFHDSDATRKEALPGFRLSEHTGMMQLPREHDVV